MRFLWAADSHVGHVRPNNEDSFYPRHDGESTNTVLVAVADGMGGHQGGKEASSLAIERSTGAEGSLAERVSSANAVVFEQARKHPRLAGMGTTLTLAEVHPKGVGTIAHVGDSRAYRWRRGRLRPLTHDDTFVQREVDAGRLTPAQARVHPDRNQLDQAVGVIHDLDIERVSFGFRVGDRLLLCSDGLTGVVGDRRIADLMGVGAPSDVVSSLIEAALSAGGLDNITVVVLEAAEADEEGTGSS